MAHVLKSLNRCVTPHLYRYVYLWPKSPWASDPPVFIKWPNSLTQMYCAADQRTRIFHLDLFKQTIVQRPDLRRCVVAASFECRVNDFENHLVSVVVEILAGSAECLHAAPEMCIPPAHYFKYLTSLEIDGEELRGSYEGALCDIFCLPMLQSISVARVKNWTCFDTSTIRADRARTSTVKNLLLRESVIPGPDLKEILTWAKALKSFRLALHFRGPQEGHEVVHRASDFSDALLPQASSLEELHVYCESELVLKADPSTLFDQPNTVDLRDFTKLRRVGLCLSFLMVSISDADFHNIDVGSFPQTYQILPPALEDLQIEMPDDFPPAVFFATDQNWEVELRAGELSSIMSAIFENKQTHLPRLKRVLFFQCRSVAEAEDLRAIPGCSQMLEHSESAGVDVSWTSCSIPPLFNH
ncbi:hypothetical protein ONS95_012929 [Cadophora gregata]|uniref:uncharacterized protein n=1 Tax=Cadophora gregata TaxID=51156 RepID=UPI0026DB48DE|nr:uncharacterized protein ONS95_012929 [Cadophora gregata]KAK0101087.1 hypothetical protein ONS96_006314 [Cadophora gregata f. sp. sojae]KAK0115882.1 hypothetical protein ONS95_012929 [Cadophora gregata]